MCTFPVPYRMPHAHSHPHATTPPTAPHPGLLPAASADTAPACFTIPTPSPPLPSCVQPHTHDYCGIGGNSNPVDSCVSGCKGSGGLPSCSARTPYFNGGSGTIMSYWCA